MSRTPKHFVGLLWFACSSTFADEYEVEYEFVGPPALEQIAIMDDCRDRLTNLRRRVSEQRASSFILDGGNKLMVEWIDREGEKQTCEITTNFFFPSYQQMTDLVITPPKAIGENWTISFWIIVLVERWDDVGNPLHYWKKDRYISGEIVKTTAHDGFEFFSFTL